MVTRYLVGGAVRDSLLGRRCEDRDWVVVGATPEDMRAAGYRLKDAKFQVYLHPETREEHALARSEKKAKEGHRGFEVDISPTITLENDLARRDFTINAIAQDEQGTFIDPFGGIADLRRRLIKHITPAFADDPLRVWRGAQLAARLASHGFTIARPTCAIMGKMCLRQEFASLSPERIWLETCKAVTANEVTTFLNVLDMIGALAVLAPGPATSFSSMGVPSNMQKNIAESQLPGEFQLITYALALDPLSRLNRAQILLQRFGLPTKHSQLFYVTKSLLASLQILPKMNPEEFLHTLQSWDALRRSQRFIDALDIIKIIIRAAPPHWNIPNNALCLIEKGFDAVRGADLSMLRDENLSGAQKQTLATTLRRDAIANAWFECKQGA